MQSIFLSVFLVFSFTSQAQVQQRCSNFLAQSTTTYTPQKVFTAQELLNIEMLAAAILASKIGLRGYEGLLRGRRNGRSENQAQFNSLSVEEKKQITSSLLDMFIISLNKRRTRNFDVKLFVKKGMRPGKLSNAIRRLVAKGVYFERDRSVDINDLKDTLRDPEAVTELEHFLSENMESIVLNALEFPVRGWLKRTWSRKANKISKLAGLSAMGGFGYWVYDFSTSLHGAELADAVYSAAQPIWIAALWGLSSASGITWSLLTNRNHSPIFDVSDYDQDVGFKIRNRYLD